MSYVCGNSGAVQALEDALEKTLQSIDAQVGDLEAAMSKISGSFNDSGVEEIQSTFNAIKSSVESSKDGAAGVKSALTAYREYLESLGR